MIKEVQRWAPVAASMLLVLLAVLWCTHTSRAEVYLPPLPAAVHVSSNRVADLSFETRAPLFAPSRSNAPIGADSKDVQTPPPALTGIVVGGGRAVALLKTAKGDTTMAHVGETVDGWSIVSISPREIVVSRSGAQQTIALVFGITAPAGGPAAAPTGSPHTMMASPTFDGLAAARGRGLPDANIPLGSPLAPTH